MWAGDLGQRPVLYFNWADLTTSPILIGRRSSGRKRGGATLRMISVVFHLTVRDD